MESAPFICVEHQDEHHCHPQPPGCLLQRRTHSPAASLPRAQGLRGRSPGRRGRSAETHREEPRVCGAIFDWDKYSLGLCKEIHDRNEKLPIFAFANDQSTLDIHLTDLRLNVHFFEYRLGMADDIALKMGQATRSTRTPSCRRSPRRCSSTWKRVNTPSVRRVTWAVPPSR